MQPPPPYGSTAPDPPSDRCSLADSAGADLLSLMDAADGPLSPMTYAEGLGSPDEAPFQSDDGLALRNETITPEHWDHTARGGSSSRGSGSDVAVQQLGEDIPRPTAAPGRPFTRRMRESQNSKGKAEVPRGKKIVYVDHHHVHHHHHFHGACDWGGPGNIPPKAERQPLELSAEADSERTRVPSGVGSSLKAPSHAVGGRARPGVGRHVGGFSSARVGTAGMAKPSSAFRPTGPDSELVYTAQSLFDRDACWPNTVSTASRSGTGGSIAAPGDAKSKLPLSEYLSLVSQLTPQTRLKFSPYGVPRSARATAGAVGAFEGPFGSARLGSVRYGYP